MSFLNWAPFRFYREGLYYALRIGLNILNMLLSFAVFVLSTKPSELVDELEKHGFSPRLGYIISSVFQIIPRCRTMSTIMDAREAGDWKRKEPETPGGRHFSP